MSEERLKILKMLDKGTITVEEANELLATLEKSDQGAINIKSEGKSKFLKIIVHEDGQKKVDISVPISLARTLFKIIPGKAKESLQREGISLEQILNAVKEGTENGTLVSINDGDDHIEIKLI